jgi:hypothetical protein
MAGSVAQLRLAINEVSDNLARNVAFLWDQWHKQRLSKIDQWTELRNYLFATDTSTTSNDGLPWKNSTTTPKLCQIRDNLHANYISALLPNSNWMKWEGGSFDDETKEKSDAITAYMRTKCAESGFRDVISKLTYDFIDYGNCFAEVEYVRNIHTEKETGEFLTIYEGPIARRISPLDIVFNPIAHTFAESPKIIRKLYSIGELVKMSRLPGGDKWEKAISKHDLLTKTVGSYSIEDFQKAVGFAVDGFGNYQEYLQSSYVEVLEFRGDYYNAESHELLTNHQIIVIDRCILVSNEPIENWLGSTSVVHVGWRYRPDNLWAMGPLDNIVGMQYRIDHLENLKADAMDLAVHPMLKIKGDVDPFDWKPGGEIVITSDGDVEELGKNLQGVIAAENAIALYENKMEEFAGAPKQAMGIRTPGEKTAFEVQQLQNAAGRIFQEKVTLFEVAMLEPLLNLMLECARRNIEATDVVRSFDDDFGVDVFLSVTKEDITARGKLRPIGARHFGEQAQLIQNINMLFSGPLGQLVQPHMSAKNLAYLVEDALQIQKYEIVRPNVGMVEQAESAQMAGNLEQSVMENQSVEY